MTQELVQYMVKMAVLDLEKQAKQAYRRGQRKKAARLRKEANDLYMRIFFSPLMGMMIGRAAYGH